MDVFTAAVASLASSPFLVTRVACAGEPGFPCHIAASEFLRQPGKYKSGIIRCDNQKQEEQVKKQLPTQLPLLGPLVRPVASTVEIHVAATPLPIPDVTPHFPQYHSWTAAERKRPLGTPISAPPSRRLVTSRWAAPAGTQLRRTAALPLLRTEVEPGEAIRHLTHQVHPFREYPKLETDLSRAVRFAARPVKAIRRKRLAMFGHWRDRAVALLPQSVEMLASTPDAQLRNYFFRDVPPGRTPRLGEVSHIALWKEMLVESRSKDRHLIASLLRGFPLLGAIQAGYEWEALDPRPDSFYSPDELAYRAWGTRQRVAEKLVRGIGRTAPDMAAAAWDKTMADVSAGYCIGPLHSEMEVTALLGTADWIAMPRFPVSQANGVRPN